MKHLKLLFISAVLLMIGTTAYGQDVTIKATNGSTVAAVKNGGTTDTFFGYGGFATWQHEQLSMVMTASDGTDLTQNGQLDNPANNLFANGDYMQIAKGQASGANVCYVTISLPKGYRFTQYTISFTKPRNAQNSEFNTANNEQSTFGETGNDFATYTTQATITTNGTAQTISRTEGAGGEMSNVLYFKLQNPSSSRALIQLEDAKFYFTAEENYTPVAPTTAVNNVSAVDVPFPTSRVDFGAIQSRTYNGTTRVSYSSANVTDLEANFTLFEAESIEDGTGIDGISGKVVKYDNGTISSAGSYFKLGKEDAEQVYYIESPSYVEVSDGTQVPVGYRIVGANIEYTKSASQNSSTTLYIYYEGQQNTYYVYTNGSTVSWSTSNKMEWTLDAKGYLRSSNGYYLYFNNGYAAVQSEEPAESERFAINDDGIYQINYPTYYITYYRQGQGQGGTRSVMVSNTTGTKASYEIISTSTEDVSVDDDFTLTIYKNDGTKDTDITVSEEGSYDITGLNNDAVKFGVKGIGFVRATLTLQALDPYLDKMEVVCQDEVQTAVRMSQTFTASDFSVSGGEFYFYLPADCAGHSVAITFEDLISKYFDETYTGGNASHTSRINFVKSAHYNAFGDSNNNLYTAVSEAANAQLERLKVGTVGTSKFKFNNADEVGTSGGTLKEYAFSLENYAESPNNGSFGEMKFTVSEEDQQLTRYVFTTDETRYNIAPTTAVQHRAYAFYEMIVHVQTATYEPQIKFTKIYDEGKTYYDAAKTDAFYGVEITASDGSGNPGYSSTDKIFEKIENILNTTKEDDFGNTDLPASAKQILYLDMSKMAGIYQITTDEHQTMEDFSATNAKNCLIFVPEGASANVNNVAEKTSSSIFQAAKNIIITDKQPFYSPYDIQVGAANYAQYERMVTNAKNGKVTSASIILPFQIAVDSEGKHTNVVITDGSAGDDEAEPTFSLHQMQTTDCLSDTAPDGYPEEDNVTYAFFPNIEVVTASEPNKPYVVKVLNPSEGNQTSFVVTQKGTLIKATTGMAADYSFTGESATGSSARGENSDGTTKNYSFTSKGTYSGVTINREDGVFYFAQNKFVCSNDLDDAHPTVKGQPFRAFYTTGSSRNLLSNFEIYFGEGIGTPTGITDVTKRIDTGIKGGKGTITIMSAIDNNVKIYNTSGMHFMNVDMQAGETKTVNVPAGIYVVNGVKIIVR